MDKSILVHDDHLLLFVAGLPSKATPSQVVDHFATFGSVRLLRLRNEKRGSRIVQANPQNNIRRGFCIVEAADKKSYDTVLNSGKIPFQGKSLNISRFILEKSQLHSDEEYLNRQVLLQGIPAGMNPSTLVAIFERFLGRIKRVYLVLSPPQFIGEELGKVQSTQCYLVEFYSASSAEKARLIKTLFLNWLKAPIHIQGFSQAPASIPCKQVFLNFNSIPDYCNLSNKHQQAYDIADLETYNTLGYVKPVMESLTAEQMFFHKPTNKMYHTSRQKPSSELNDKLPNGTSSKALDELSYCFRLSACKTNNSASPLNLFV